MDIAQCLVAAQDPNVAVRQPAEAQIEQAKQTNLVRAARTLAWGSPTPLRLPAHTTALAVL